MKTRKLRSTAILHGKIDGVITGILIKEAGVSYEFSCLEDGKPCQYMVSEGEMLVEPTDKIGFTSK